jgi:glyoxalase family protein
MENTINGIHHITAIAGNAKTNFDFYTKVLGLRFIKKTVNFDDPETYHLYYGDKKGTPGSILTFFPWEGMNKGMQGSRQATEIGYSVPEDSLEFWMKRFDDNKITYSSIAERFGERYLSVLDPDGLRLELIAGKKADTRTPWETDEVKAVHATKGFYSITVTTNKMQPTANILTDIFGYKLLDKEAGRYRFITDAVENAAIVDLLEVPDQGVGYSGVGTVHHVAFRVKNEEILMQYHDRIVKMGLSITGKIDRNYFYSLYFREPGGVLFEIATDNPGFSVDEPVEELGTHLKLPAQYERLRADLEKLLPKLM